MPQTGVTEMMNSPTLPEINTLFAQSNPPVGITAARSNAARAAGLHRGSIFVGRGGHSGRGELSIELKTYLWYMYVFLFTRCE